MIKDHNQNPLNYSQTQAAGSMIPHHCREVPLEAVLEQVENQSVEHKHTQFDL